jgi:hypothetical protein
VTQLRLIYRGRETYRRLRELPARDLRNRDSLAIEFGKESTGWGTGVEDDRRRRPTTNEFD